MDLRTLLETVIAGGLGGSLIYVVLANWLWFAGLQPDIKRVIAFVANALIAIVALLVAIGMGYTPPPVGATDSAWSSPSIWHGHCGGI